MTRDDKPHYNLRGQCPTCEAPAPCPWMAERAAGEWRMLANVWEPLHAYLEPQRRGANVGHTPPASKPPLSVSASLLIADIRDWAWFYASALMDETPDYVAPRSTEQRLRDIASRYGHFTVDTNERWVKPTVDMPEGHWQRVAIDFCDRAHELVNRARGLVEQPPPPRFMGPCRDTECGGDVYLIAFDKMPRCTTCDLGHDAADMRQQLIRALESRLLKRDELREALNIAKPPGSKRVPAATMRQWIKRGRLVPVIRDPELFRMTDAMELAGIKVST